MLIPGLKNIQIKCPTLYEDTANNIDRTVSEYYGIPIYKMVGVRRQRSLVVARQIAMLLSRKYTKLGIVAIGQRFRRDHTSVVHSCKTIQDLIDTDELIRKQVKEIEARILQ
jgi:chromosomal replication initiator protein